MRVKLLKPLKNSGAWGGNRTRTSPRPVYVSGCSGLTLAQTVFYLLLICTIFLTSCAITREGCRSQVLRDVAIAVENHRDYRIAVYLVEHPFIYGAHTQLQVKDGPQWLWMDIGGIDKLNCDPEHEIKKGTAVWLMTLDEYLKFLWDYERLHAGLDGDYYKAERGK